MIKAIEQGFVQQEIQNAAYDVQQKIDRGEMIVVGVNRFAAQQEKPVPIQRIDEMLERKQVERVRALRARRDASRWQSAIKRLKESASSGANLVPVVVEAVEQSCTVGEIANSLREIFGEHRETVVV